MNAVIAPPAVGVAAPGASSRASSPDAIARHTARLPTVFCIERITPSVATGTTAGAATGGAACGAAWACSIARLYRRVTRIATIRSSPERGEPRPSRLDVATQSVPSGAAATVRIRP